KRLAVEVLELPIDLVSAGPRQTDIEKHQVRLRPTHGAERVVAVDSQIDGQPRALEQRPRECAEARIVIHNQHPVSRPRHRLPLPLLNRSLLTHSPSLGQAANRWIVSSCRVLTYATT